MVHPPGSTPWLRSTSRTTSLTILPGPKCWPEPGARTRPLPFQSKTDNHGLAEDALRSHDMPERNFALLVYKQCRVIRPHLLGERVAPLSGPKLTLPVAVTVFPRDIPSLPRSWIEDTYADLIHYGAADKGGHFAAFEQPEILISEIRTGLRSLRSENEPAAGA
jgi:pimeloyl-ACP methyl ester carboxylesterase